MKKPDLSIITHREPNYYAEAVQLMLSFFWDQKELCEGAPAWEDGHLIRRFDRFILPPGQIDQAFPDVITYLHLCRKEARPFLEAEQHLNSLLEFRLSGMAEDVQQEPFLASAFSLVDVESSRLLTKPLFIRGCLLHLYTNSMASGMGTDLESDEAQAYFERISNPDSFNMAQIMKAVDQLHISDTQRMVLLRFFQDIDSWYLRLSALLIQLETICQAHYPLMADRFLSKASALDGKGDSAPLSQWLSRMNFDVLSTQEPIHLWPTIISYNSLSFRLSPWQHTRSQIHAGILFDELSDLQDAQRAREDLTQEQLKALADPSRMSIVRLLSQRPWYVQELADQLNLTPATLSHHMRILSGALLAGVHMQGRRSYYHLNAQELAALSDDLGALAGRAKEGAQ